MTHLNHCYLLCFQLLQHGSLSIREGGCTSEMNCGKPSSSFVFWLCSVPSKADGPHPDRRGMLEKNGLHPLGVTSWHGENTVTYLWNSRKTLISLHGPMKTENPPPHTHTHTHTHTHCSDLLTLKYPYSFLGFALVVFKNGIEVLSKIYQWFFKHGLVCTVVDLYYKYCS